MTTDDLRDTYGHSHAIAAWQHHAELMTEIARKAADSREARMDVQRKLTALKRAQQALTERSRLMAERSLEVLQSTGPSALLVHRHEWTRRTMAGRLDALGVVVLASLDDGADGLGVTIAEQPSLLFIEDRLASVTAHELVREVRQFSPRTLVAAQVEYEDEIGELLEAGAAAVFSRNVPPAVIVEQTEALLHDPRLSPVVVH